MTPLGGSNRASPEGMNFLCSIQSDWDEIQGTVELIKSVILTILNIYSFYTFHNKQIVHINCRGTLRYISIHLLHLGMGKENYF